MPKDDLNGLNISTLKKVAKIEKVPYYGTYRKGDEVELQRVIRKIRKLNSFKPAKKIYEKRRVYAPLYTTGPRSATANLPSQVLQRIAEHSDYQTRRTMGSMPELRISKTEKDIEYETYINRIRRNPYEIGEIPPEMVEEVIRQVPYAIRFVPRELITHKMAEQVVRQLPSLIRDIPRDMVTQEMANYAVERDLESILFIPSKFRTREMIDRVQIEDPELFMDMI